MLSYRKRLANDNRRKTFGTDKDCLKTESGRDRVGTGCFGNDVFQGNNRYLPRSGYYDPGRRCAEAIRILEEIGTSIPHLPNQNYKTKYFCPFLVEGEDAELIAGFIIVKDGVGL